MKQTPLHLIVSRMRGIALHHQIAFLRNMIALEKPFSVRRNELESILTGKMTKQIRKEIKQDNRRGAVASEAGPVARTGSREVVAITLQHERNIETTMALGI